MIAVDQTDPPHEPVVVHLLDNSAVEFTDAYLNATLFTRQKTGVEPSGSTSARDHHESSRPAPESTGTLRTTTSEDEQEASTKSSTGDGKGASAP